MSPFVILGVSGLFCCFNSISDETVYYPMLTNTVDTDQMPHYVVSDLDLLCLPVTFFTGFQVRMGEDKSSVQFGEFVLLEQNSRQVTILGVILG